jgi:hypothetical protein
MKDDLPRRVSRARQRRRTGVVERARSSNAVFREERLGTASGALALGAGILLGACSLVLEADRQQCETDADCSRLGPDFEDTVCVEALCRTRPDPRWDCLDREPTALAAPVPELVRVTVPVIDVVTGEQVPGVEVMACGGLDGECVMPLAAGVTNPRGESELRLPGGFNGYLRCQAPSIFPTLYFFGAPLTEDSTAVVNVVTPAVVQGLDAQDADVTVPGRSRVVVDVLDCTGAPAAGVRVSIPEGDSATIVGYMVDGLYPPSQMETSNSGVARILNIAEGNITIQGRLADGRAIGSAAVLTRREFVTLANLRAGQIP